MTRLFYYIPLFLITSMAMAADEPQWNKVWQDFSQLEDILMQIPEGAAIVNKAKERDPDFLVKLRRGQASYTESTFARSYSLLDAKEQIQVRHEVTVSDQLSLAEAVADLAHELVHFTEKEMLDPYQVGFELKDFIVRGIEGKGGELAALEKECLVAWSLERKFTHYPKHSLCAPYRSKEDAFLREAARSDYYALGHWYRKAKKDWGDLFPLISNRAVRFNSSYASKPYPVALWEEYLGTRKAACDNNRRKYRLIAAQSEGRSPASHDLQKERERLRGYEKRYCATHNDAANVNFK